MSKETALRDPGDSPSCSVFILCLTPAVPNLRLQTGMRGAFGKPQGTVARGHIGQVIMSICTKLQSKEHVIEALHRAKFKFPGRQKILISKKWGFTKFNADEFEDMVAEKRLIPDSCGVKYIPNRGPLDKWRWRALHS
ncbi:large ribosomal subunit protein uL16-like [Erinaceus europaeus]|uniref:Large ribosomal subunit protein uL16-like n=1 Tax=Erinaceus europaeus TaxID=9365 RepID=A0ABM3WCF9_ERIEU|nr:large ribosomal subunit protein uL16-like [Erinaceus europaeus]